MVYTPEEKKKMDNVIQAFAEYTANHREFDIAYSDKSGYVRLIIAENADSCFFSLGSFDELMDMFCMELVSEEVERQCSKDPDLKNRDVDYDIVRRQIQDYISRMEPAYQKEAADLVNNYLLKRSLSPLLP